MIFFQAVDANQWVVVDLGQTSLVCGIVTQGRGKSKALNAHVSTRMQASDRAASDFEYVLILCCNGVQLVFPRMSQAADMRLIDDTHLQATVVDIIQVDILSGSPSIKF